MNFSSDNSLTLALSQREREGVRVFDDMKFIPVACA
jgi:hypothetical protein